MSPSHDRPKLTFVIGCTGCGKGALGRELALRLGAAIVSIDSMKVYRRMDIGTAKPSAEVRQSIPHYMIDVAEPSETFSAARYVALAEGQIADLHRAGTPILVVGGTPLYIKALTEGLFDGPSADPSLRERLHQEAERLGTPTLHQRLMARDPQAAMRIHPNDLRRIVRALEVHELTGARITQLQTQWERGASRYLCTFIGLRRNRDDQNARTNRRVHAMIDAGLVDEVRRLLAEPKPLSDTARSAVGYAEIIDHLDGLCSLDEAVERIKVNTRHLAKAQRTWFKRFRDVHWVDVQPDDRADALAERLICQGVTACSTSPK